MTTPTVTFTPTGGFDGSFAVGNVAGLSHAEAFFLLRDGHDLGARRADRILTGARRLALGIEVSS